MVAEGEGTTLSVLPSRKVLREVDELVDRVVVELLVRDPCPALVAAPQDLKDLGGRRDVVIDATELVHIDGDELLEGNDDLAERLLLHLLQPSLQDVSVVLLQLIDGAANLLEDAVVELRLHQARPEEEDDEHPQVLQLVARPRTSRRGRQLAQKPLERQRYHVVDDAVGQSTLSIHHGYGLPALCHGGEGLANRIEVDARALLVGPAWPPVLEEAPARRLRARQAPLDRVCKLQLRAHVGLSRRCCLQELLEGHKLS
mmetsp:Transcript_44875/g.141306  ORF Transcript_44875/g.141306 Transcript_44875/m.141306 type:complete len:258 (-) Transcript_44875:637-1410(-)